MYSIGKIKWFGGTSSKTGLNNDYGFVKDMSGHDAFLHASEWSGEVSPREGDLVVYSLREHARGAKAVNALPAAAAPETLDLASSLLKRLVEYRPAPRQMDRLECHVRRTMRNVLIHADPNEFRRLLELMMGCEDWWALLATGADWESDLARFAESGRFEPFEVIPWRLLPSASFGRNEPKLAAFLDSLQPEEASQLIRGSHDRLLRRT